MGIFKKIVSTEILTTTTDSKKSASSTLIRGAVGGALLGPAGMLAGGLSGKNKIQAMTTFLITYDDGSQQTDTVKNDSIMYTTYMQFLNKK